MLASCRAMAKDDPRMLRVGGTGHPLPTVTHEGVAEASLSVTSPVVLNGSEITSPRLFDGC
jgi:hypothetical protein